MANNNWQSEFLSNLRQRMQQEQANAQWRINTNQAGWNAQLGQQGLGQQTIGGQFRPQNLQELNIFLEQRKRHEATKPKPISKEARIAEIEHELDICRGVNTRQIISC